MLNSQSVREETAFCTATKCQCESTEGGKKGQEAQSKHRPLLSLTILSFKTFPVHVLLKYSTLQLFKSRKTQSASKAPFLEALRMGEFGGKYSFLVAELSMEQLLVTSQLGKPPPM